MIKKFALLFLLLAVALSLVKAQKKINEGTVIYTLSYELAADQQQFADLLPKEITYYFRGDSTAAISKQGDAIIKGVSVFKTNCHSMIIDIPVVSRKIFVVMTPDEVEQEKSANPSLTGKKGTEKQVIDGYNCVKTVITNTKTGAAYDIWLTNDIYIVPNSMSRIVSVFGGVPIKFVTFNNGIKINAEVKEIKETTVPVGFFTATKDYEPMSLEKLKALSSGK